MTLTEAIAVVKTNLEWQPSFLQKLAMSEDQQQKMEEGRLAIKIILEHTERTDCY